MRGKQVIAVRGAALAALSALLVLWLSAWVASRLSLPVWAIGPAIFTWCAAYAPLAMWAVFRCVDCWWVLFKERQ